MLDHNKNYINRNLTDKDMIELSNGEILNAKDLNLRGSSITTRAGGLYDKRIFGTDCYCECNLPLFEGGTCPTCGVTRLSQDDLEFAFGHYNLTFPYVSPFQIPTFVKLLNSVLSETDSRILKISRVKSYLSVLRRIYCYEFTSLYDQIIMKEASEESNIDNIGLIGLYNLDSTNKRVQDLKDLLHKTILISNPQTRMYSTVSLRFMNTVTFPLQTIQYRAIITTDQCYKSANFKSMQDRVAYIIGIQNLISQYMMSNPITATHKQSTIRSSVAYHTKMSGRATIVSDQNLPISTVSIPKRLLKISLDTQIRQYLTANGLKWTEITKPHSEEVDNALREILNQTTAVLVRNPTLHKYNTTAFHVIPNDDNVIRIPHLICKSYNADFDGDQMAYFLVTGDKAQDTYDKMSAESHFYYIKDKSVAYAPNRELLQGLSVASKPNTIDDNLVYPEFTIKSADEEFLSGNLNVTDIISIGGRRLTYGRHKISSIVGYDIDEFLQNDFIRVYNISQILILIDEKKRVDALKDLQNFSIQVLKLIGFTSLTLKDLYIDTKEKYSKEFDKILNSDLSPEDLDYQLSVKLTDVLSRIIDDLPVQDLKKTIKESNRYKPEQLTKLVGPTIISDGNGNYDIDYSTHLDGMHSRAYIEESISNRRIWQFKQSQVPISGYNARQLMMLGKELMYENTPNTKDTTPIIISSDEKSFLKNREILGSSSEFPGYVEVRSSIFNDEKVIHNNEIDSSLYGNKSHFNIGIDMMTSLSEPITQKSLSLKHGGTEWSYHNTDFRAEYDYEDTEIKDGMIYLTRGSRIDKYPLPTGAIINQERKLKVGDIIYQLPSKLHLTNFISSMVAFLRVNMVQGSILKIPTVQCYTINGGKIHYEKDKVIVGREVYKYYEDCIYKYPDGATVEPFSRICSGILDNSYYSKNFDNQLLFTIFRKQFLELLPSINPDIIEILFKLIKDSNMSVSSNLNTSDNLIDALYRGNTKGGKKVLSKYINDNSIKLYNSNDLIFNLVMGE